MRVSIRERVLRFVAKNPGKTAVQISRWAHADAASVSSILCRMCKAGELRREDIRRDNGRHFLYYVP